MRSSFGPGAGRKRLRFQERQRLLTSYHRSRLTQAEFTQRHGIGLSTLGKWLREERGQNGTAAPIRFEELALPQTTAPWAVELISPQGWTVRLRNSSEAEVLPDLLATLPC